MSKPPPRVVPTLTEVVDRGRSGAPARAPANAPANAPTAPARTAAVPAADAKLADDEQALVQRVLAEAMRQAGPIVERRLRVALAQSLTKLADSFVQNARDEIARSVHEALAKALEQELTRRKQR